MATNAKAAKKLRREVNAQTRDKVAKWLGPAERMAQEGKRDGMEQGLRRGLKIGAAGASIVWGIVLALVCLFALGCTVAADGINEDGGTSDAGADVMTDAQGDTRADAMPVKPRGCPDTVQVVGYCDERDNAGRACAKCSALKPGVACLMNENIRCAFECRECAQ